MKIFNIFAAILIAISISIPADIKSTQPMITQEQAEKLGNFMDKLWGELPEEERKMLAEQIEQEQEKLLAMTPEERAQKEAEVAMQLEELMSEDSPYYDMFQAPAHMLPEETAEVVDEKEKISTESHQPAVKKETKAKTKPSSKKKNKNIMQKIASAADSILIKTNNMKEIQHKSWNKNKWNKLKSNLQILQAKLQIAADNEAILTDLLNNEHKDLVNGLEKFEKVITTQASNLKTPDSMGLVVVKGGKAVVVNQKRYDDAVVQLKKVISKLNSELATYNIVSKISGLVSKHKPKEKKTIVSKPGKPLPKVSAAKKELTVCNTDQEKRKAIKTIEKSASEIKRCSNTQLLEMANKYAKNKKTIATSKNKTEIDSAKQQVNALSRKLQWKLSELKVHTGKAANTIKTVPACKKEVSNALGSHNDYKTLQNIVSVLSSIEESNNITTLANNIKSDVNIIIV